MTHLAESWIRLLNPNQLGKSTTITSCGPTDDQGRNPFEKDRDLVVFSFAFRRLQNKTQVHPLPNNDHVHNRLTHSMEVASVARSLGTAVGNVISKREADSFSEREISYHTFSSISQAASLAHDIGNPPYGHSGEDSIQAWFQDNASVIKHMDPRYQADLLNFEGNAQGFRIITQLENDQFNGGLHLSYGTLGAFLKYPSPAYLVPEDNNRIIANKKNGYFLAEKNYIDEIQENINLPVLNNNTASLARHPLVYLVEAADDICYATVDIEDGFLLGYIPFDEAEEILGRFLTPEQRQWAHKKKYENAIVQSMRAVAIGNLVSEAKDAFLANEEKLLSGELHNDLLQHITHADDLENTKTQARRLIFQSKRKILMELGGDKIITGLMDILTEVVEPLSHNGWNIENLPRRPKKLCRLLDQSFRGQPINYFSHIRDLPEDQQLYEGYLRITDFISGMTDRYAANMYRELMGHKA